jgi:hypothetical protein
MNEKNRRKKKNEQKENEIGVEFEVAYATGETLAIKYLDSLMRKIQLSWSLIK